MIRIFAVAALAFATAAAAQPAKTPDVVDSSFTTADGQRDLQQSIVIDAPVGVLWKAFADTAEFKRWNSPVASIDLRVGGTLEASYDPAKALGDPDNIKHRIVTFLPERLIVFQNVQAPHALTNADRFQRTVTVLQYEPLGPARTRVTLSSTGWGDDPASQAVYAFFQAGNAELLEQMKATYEAR
ncbi:MAG TPA: SRPBCC domain-containing protein [Caulobacteraceae bacterium]|nr:SRPBCC domain-containing protein [Caulobacteraceae bacterium]